jgi:hypothetical protein
MTGSITSGIRGTDRLSVPRIIFATAEMISAEQSRPVLIAAIRKFFASTSICSRTIFALTASIRETFPGISATIQVAAVNP